MALNSLSVHTMPSNIPHDLTAVAGAGAEAGAEAEAEADAFSATRVTALKLLPLVLRLAVSTCNADDERLQEGTGGKEAERLRR